MISKKDVMDAVFCLLRGAFPDDDIHADLCPAGFDRPAFLIETPRMERSPVNCNTVEERLDLTITCFVQVDDWHRSAAEDLAARQDAALELFRDGVILTGGRAVRCDASSGGMDFDRAWVDLTVRYWETRRAPEPSPAIGEIEINTEYQEG